MNCVNCAYFVKDFNQCLCGFNFVPAVSDPLPLCDDGNNIFMSVGGSSSEPKDNSVSESLILTSS